MVKCIDRAVARGGGVSLNTTFFRQDSYLHRPNGAARLAAAMDRYQRGVRKLAWYTVDLFARSNATGPSALWAEMNEAVEGSESLEALVGMHGRALGLTWPDATREPTADPR